MPAEGKMSDCKEITKKMSFSEVLREYPKTIKKERGG